MFLNYFTWIRQSSGQGICICFRMEAKVVISHPCCMRGPESFNVSDVHNSKNWPHSLLQYCVCIVISRNSCEVIRKSIPLVDPIDRIPPIWPKHDQNALSCRSRNLKQKLLWCQYLPLRTRCDFTMNIMNIVSKLHWDLLSA